MGIKGPHTAKGGLGEALREDDLESFSAEQVAQLYELYQESSKPIDLANDPHLAKDPHLKDLL